MQATLDPKKLQRFRDPVWRISNLYAIRTRDGKVVPFRPRPQQLQVLQMIYRQGLKRIVILKARQLGFSTLLGIICTDQLCWTTGKQLSLIDRTQENARQKLRDIVALAYDSLHDELKARFIVDRSNAGEFGVRFHEYEAAQTSTLFAGTHARGGANSFLWISRMGFRPMRRPSAIGRDSDRRSPERERWDNRRRDDMARWTWRSPLGHRKEGA